MRLAHLAKRSALSQLWIMTAKIIYLKPNQPSTNQLLTTA